MPLNRLHRRSGAPPAPPPAIVPPLPTNPLPPPLFETGSVFVPPAPAVRVPLAPPMPATPPPTPPTPMLPPGAEGELSAVPVPQPPPNAPRINSEIPEHPRVFR